MNKNTSWNIKNIKIYKIKNVFQTVSLTISMYGFISLLVCIFVSVSIYVNEKKKRRESIVHLRIQTKRHAIYLFCLSLANLLIFLILLITQSKEYLNLRNILLTLLLLQGIPVSKFFSSWILVGMSFDTVLSIIYHRSEYNVFYKILHPLCVLGVIFLIIIPIYGGIVAPIYMGFFDEDFLNNTRRNETIENNFEKMVAQIFTISDFYIFINSIVPFILITISTLILVKTILKRGELSLVQQNKRKFVKRIIFMNISFFIFALPMYFSLIYSHYCRKNRNSYYCQYYFFYFSFLSEQIDYAHRASLSIILYFTNKLFRKEFIKILTWSRNCSQT